MRLGRAGRTPRGRCSAAADAVRSCGWSRRVRGLSHLPAHPAPAPESRQSSGSRWSSTSSTRHRAEQPVVLVDDRRGDQVVRGEVAGDLARSVASGAQRVGVVLDDAAHQRGRRLAQQPLQVRGAEEPAGRRRLRRPHDEHLRGQGRRQLGVAHQRERLGHRRVRAAGSPARRSSGRRQCSRRRSSADAPARPRRAPSAASSRSWSAAGHLAEQVGGVVVVHRLEDVGGALVGERAQQARSGRPRAAPAGRRPAARRRAPAATSMRRLAGMSCSDGSDVGGAHVRQHRQQRLGALARLGQAQPVHLVPGDLDQLPTSATQPALVRIAEPGEHPVAGAVLLHRARRRRWRCCAGLEHGDATCPAVRRARGSRSARRSKRFMLTVPLDSTTAPARSG